MDRSGWPTKELTVKNIERVQKIMENDRRSSVRTDSGLTGLSNDTIFRILHDHLHMTKLCPRWVPQMLTRTR